MPFEKPPDRAAASGNSVLAHGNLDLIQGQIRMLGDQFAQPGGIRLQRRCASPIGLTAALPNRTQRCTHRTPNSRSPQSVLPPRAATHPPSQRPPPAGPENRASTSIPPAKREMRKDSLIRPGESRQFTQIGICFSSPEVDRLRAVAKRPEKYMAQLQHNMWVTKRSDGGPLRHHLR
jgi:hypothetical protein